MAAQAWKLYPLAKHKIGAGDLPLDHTHFRISYVKSVFTTNTYSIWPQLVSAGIAVDTTDKYPVSGFDLGSGIWTGYASAKSLTRKFDLTNPAVLRPRPRRSRPSTARSSECRRQRARTAFCCATPR